MSLLSCSKIGQVCEKTTICGNSVDVCSNGVQTYYEVNGKKYNCDGTDCTNAANRLVNDLCDKGISSDESYYQLIDVAEIQNNK